MIYNKIQDGEGSKRIAGVKNTREYGNGLKVYAFDGNPLELGQRNFTNETYGSALNQNATATGTPDQVHDGIDSVLWTASAISGTWTFNSTAQAHTGTNSIDGTATVNGSIAEIDKGSNLTIGNYSNITGWIYISAWSTSGTKQVNIYGWDTTGATAVSDLVDIGNYVNITTTGVWQQFSIPFADLNFTASTLDAVRIQVVDIGGGQAPNFYLDDIQFEETGGSIIFTVAPDPGEKWWVKGLNYVLVDAYAGTVTGGTMPSIPYTGFLGVGTLTNGTLVRRIQFGEVKFSSTTIDLIDYIVTGAPKKILSGSDGTNTWVRLEADFTYPVLLDGDRGDRYEIVINDDLTGLLQYKANIVFGVAPNGN